MITVWVGPLVVKELKRIVEQSEITKYVSFPFELYSLSDSQSRFLFLFFREDDTNWPKKNIVGKQELEIRVGNDHIAFEVRLFHFHWVKISTTIIIDRESWLFSRYTG